MKTLGMNGKTNTDSDMSDLKDSGKRQDFPTGSKRDLQDGKGRFDLVMLGWPRALTLLAKHMEKGYKKYGTDPLTGVPEPAWRNNWTRGQPLSRYLDSATRHLTKFCANETDEDHLTAAIWNLLSLLETGRRIEDGLLSRELNDIGREVSVLHEPDKIIGQSNKEDTIIHPTSFNINDLVTFDNDFHTSMTGYVVGIDNKIITVIITTEGYKGMQYKVDTEKVKVSLLK